MSRPADSGLYFIAWIPHGKLLEELDRLKKDFADEFNVRRALKSPPHITFQMPFRWPLKREALLMKSLSTIESSPFTVALNGFGAFAPRVLFVRPVESPELRSLYQEVQDKMKALGILDSTYRNQGFSPHVTIAHGDVKKPVFLKAWERYSTLEFKAEQQVDTISLLKHDGKRWQVAAKFGLRVIS